MTTITDISPAPRLPLDVVEALTCGGGDWQVDVAAAGADAPEWWGNPFDVET